MRPALARALEFAARALERGGRRARLEPEALLAGARRRTGLSDFGDPAFELGLETLCASARDDAGLTPAGRLIFEQSVLRQLVNRLTWRHGRTMQRREFHTPLQPPIMVVGPPRWGRPFCIGCWLSTPGTAACRRMRCSSPSRGRRLPPGGAGHVPTWR